MSTLKVSTRLYLLIGMFAALLAVVGLLGLWGLRAADASLQTVHDDRAVPLGQLARIQHALDEDKASALHAVADPRPEELRRQSAGVVERQALKDRLWAAYMATTLTREEAEIARRLAAQRAEFERDGVAAALAQAVAGQMDAANTIVDDRVVPSAERLSATMNALLQLQIDVARDEADAAARRYQAMLMAVSAILGAGLLFGGLAGWAIVRSLTRALGAEPAEAAALVRAVAAGDLTVQVPVRPGDTTSLSASLAAMVAGLRQAVGSVRRDADSVAVASTQIAQGNLDLSQRTEEQASALQQTAASMEQLNASVTRNAEAMRLARDGAGRAAQTAVEGGEAVAQVVETMRGIEESARRIGEIIATIDGIAFQTNILALNAAVEAARAGDQGRGFAVVAGEVRVLAQRSAEASREIRSLITASVERVEAGGMLVDRAGATMRDIVASIEQVSRLAAEISAASDEQAAGVAQIGQAVAQMDTVTQRNAALVEESSAAADSLRQQSTQLQQAVAVFRTGADTLAA